MLKTICLGLIGLSLFTSCKKEDESSDVAVDLSSSCSYSGTLTYDIGVDITTDFNESNIAVTNKVLQSNCSRLSVGKTVNTTTENVKRVGGVITFTLDSGSGAAESLTVVSGNTLSLPASETASADGDSISVSFASALLVPDTKEIVLSYTASLTSAFGELSSRKMSVKEKFNGFYIPFE